MLLVLIAISIDPDLSPMTTTGDSRFKLKADMKRTLKFCYNKLYKKINGNWQISRRHVKPNLNEYLPVYSLKSYVFCSLFQLRKTIQTRLSCCLHCFPYPKYQTRVIGSLYDAL